MTTETMYAVTIVATLVLMYLLGWAARPGVEEPAEPGVFVYEWGVFAARLEDGKLVHAEFTTPAEAVAWYQERSASC